MNPTVYVALGSNLGNSAAILREALERLQELSSGPVRQSSFWRSQPIDCPAGSPPFVNAAIELKPYPSETPESLLAKLKQIEKDFGRLPKKVPNEPRPLDLDLIAFGGLVRSTPELALPHPRAHLRRFVLAPLAEIAPDLVLPGGTQSVRQLLDNLSPDQVVTRLSEESIRG